MSQEPTEVRPPLLEMAQHHQHAQDLKGGLGLGLGFRVWGLGFGL